MASSLICTLDRSEDLPNPAEIPGRIVTTVPKAKELRPYVERLVTMARKARNHEQAAQQYGTEAQRGSDEWQRWRQSDQWQNWVKAVAPAVALRRRAFSLLRNKRALEILFDELAERFADRDGGYTRVVRLSAPRLGDAGERALIEFVGERDRVKTKRRAAPVVEDEPAEAPEQSSAEEDSAEG